MTEDLDAEVARLAEREGRLVLPRLTNDDAWRLGCLAVDLARERGLGVVVSIRRGGQVLFHHGLEGSAPDNDAWVLRKSRVAERFGESSFLVGRRCALAGKPFEERMRLDPDTYAAHGGSVPLRVEGVGVVGSLTVSGLPQRDDHELACEILERWLAGETAGSPSGAAG